MVKGFDRKNLMYFICFGVLVIVFGIPLFISFFDGEKLDILEVQGTIVFNEDDMVTILDDTGNYYNVNMVYDGSIGDSVLLKYTGVLDVNDDNLDVKVIEYKILISVNGNSIPSEYQDNGIFSDYYELAYEKLQEMSLDEKIAQMLLVRYPDNNPEEILKEYGFGGVVFYEKDFRDKTKTEVQSMMNRLQEVSDIPIITAVDEEGGNVVRISSNSNLRETPFLSPSELYASGGFDKISNDTKEKSKLLKNLGVNVNLAPVVDVATDENAYIYERTLKEDTKLVSDYAKTVIEASKGTGVSYTLKHFPGYGDNTDTHIDGSTDNRSLEEIMTDDIPPFEAGIKAGAEAVMVAHNIVSSIDMANPASLSPNVHSLLRDDLGFTGVIIADDIAMEAISGIEDAVVFAVNAGNNLIITTDYEDSFNDIKSAVENMQITEEQIDELVFKVLAWKYYKGLMFENLK